MFSKGSPKKTVNFKDIGIKGGWVLVSKPNFFYIRNYDLYQRWVGAKHRCHYFIFLLNLSFYVHVHVLYYYVIMSEGE